VSQGLKAVVIGSGNIGTDLLMKCARTSELVDVVAMAGIDPASDGLLRAAEMGVATTAGGVDSLLEMAVFDDAAMLGRLDVAVFNAGAQHRQRFLEIDPVMLEKVWRLGCRAGFVVGQAAAKQMVEHGKGTIIFTGATSATRGGAEFTAFAAAKAGLRSISQSMARSLGPRGIHVCHVVVDGVIDMPAIHERFPDLVAGLPEGGMLDTDAIAQTYYALHCQDRAAWTLEIDVRPWCETF